MKRRLLPVESRRRVVRAVLTLVLSAGFSVPCAAQSSDAPASGPARELWLEGKQLADAGDYDRAVDRFDRAYEIEHTPALGLWVARTLARAGHLLQASARYRDLALQTLPPDASTRDWAAKREAESERTRLVSRIPSVVVALEGATKEEVSITVNGQPLPTPAIGSARLVDPGLVRVRATRRNQTTEASVDIAEGELKTLKVSFSLPPPIPRAPAPGEGSGRKTTAQTGLAAEALARRTGDSQRVVGYVSMGVGGAAVLTGAVFGLLAVDDESRLQNECEGSRCPSALSSDVDAYQSRKTVAAVALLAGAAVTTTGLVLYLTAPRAPRSARVGFYWHGSSAGLSGAF